MSLRKGEFGMLINGRFVKNEGISRFRGGWKIWRKLGNWMGKEDLGMQSLDLRFIWRNGLRKKVEMDRALDLIWAKWKEKSCDCLEWW